MHSVQMDEFYTMNERSSQLLLYVMNPLVRNCPCVLGSEVPEARNSLYVLCSGE